MIAKLRSLSPLVKIAIAVGIALAAGVVVWIVFGRGAAGVAVVASGVPALAGLLKPQERPSDEEVDIAGEAHRRRRAEADQHRADLHQGIRDDLERVDQEQDAAARAAVDAGLGLRDLNDGAGPDGV